MLQFGKLLRNLPLYALASFPIMAILLMDVLQGFNLDKIEVKPQLNAIFKTAAAVFLFFIMMITGLVSEINKTLFYFLLVTALLFYMSWARSYLNGVIREVKR